jgi:pimeloyl-ACP methyl ester carboxylesterase
MKRLRVWIGLGIALAVFLFAFNFVIVFFAPDNQAPYHSSYTTINNVNLYTQQIGSGKPLVCLHGFPYHSGAFDALVPYLQDQFTLIMIDLPGLGYSDKRKLRHYSPEALALFVKLFLDQEGLTKVSVLGHDLGGGVALTLAAEYPHMVDKVILLAPDSSLGRGVDSLNPVWNFPAIREIWASLVLNRIFIREYLRRSWHAGDERWRELVEQFTQPLATQNGRFGFLGALHEARTFDYRPFMDHYSTPTLILWGEQDRINFSALGLTLTNQINPAQIKLLPECGHLPHQEQPQRVAEYIKDFLLHKEASSTLPAPGRAIQ